jgi:hypothetical protein
LESTRHSNALEQLLLEVLVPVARLKFAATVNNANELVVWHTALSKIERTIQENKVFNADLPVPAPLARCARDVQCRALQETCCDLHFGTVVGSLYVCMHSDCLLVDLGRTKMNDFCSTCST